jgi:hypothetical protein
VRKESRSGTGQERKEDVSRGGKGKSRAKQKRRVGDEEHKNGGKGKVRQELDKVRIKEQ